MVDTCREYLQVASIYCLSICIVVCVFCVFILQTGCVCIGSTRLNYGPLRGWQIQHVEIWHKGHSRTRHAAPNVPVEGRRCRTLRDAVCNRGHQPRRGNTLGGLSGNAAWGEQIYMHVTDGSIIHYNGILVQVTKRKVTHKGCFRRIDLPLHCSCLLQYCNCLTYDNVRWRCCSDKHVYNQCFYTLQDTNNAGSSVKLSGLRRWRWRSDATEPDLQYSAGLGARMSPCGKYVLCCRGGAGAVAPTPSSRLCYAALWHVCLIRIFCLCVRSGATLYLDVYSPYESHIRRSDVYYFYGSHSRIMYILLDYWMYLIRLVGTMYKWPRCIETICTLKVLKTTWAAIKYNTIYLRIVSYFAYHNVYTYLCFIYIRYRLGVKLAPLVNGQHKSIHHWRTYDPTYMRSAALANQGQRGHESSRRGKGPERNRPTPRLMNSYMNNANGTLSDHQLSSKMRYIRYQCIIKDVGFRDVYVRLCLVQDAWLIFIMILCKAWAIAHKVQLLMCDTCIMLQHIFIMSGGGISLIKRVHDYWQKHTKNFVLE